MKSGRLSDELTLLSKTKGVLAAKTVVKRTWGAVSWSVLVCEGVTRATHPSGFFRGRLRRISLAEPTKDGKREQQPTN
eukprot:scaffold356577_cov28-Attheya_sp.AAC.1